MTTTHYSGIEAAQRRLNGPQTTGRTYRIPVTACSYDDIAVRMRDLH